MATARNASASASGRLDFESETFVVAPEVTSTLRSASDSPKAHGKVNGTDRATIIAHCATGDVFHTLRAEGFDASEDGTGRGGAVAVHAFDARQADVLQYGNITGPMDTGIPGPSALVGAQVRRLTPTECERLQGFPDGHTRIPWRGKGPDDCPDGPRYKALGNSMAVPVIRWIGEAIERATKKSSTKGKAK